MMFEFELGNKRVVVKRRSECHLMLKLTDMATPTISEFAFIINIKKKIDNINIQIF